MSIESVNCCIKNPKGIHCRVATRIAEIVSAHDSLVQLKSENGQVDCLSILDILSLALIQDTQVVVTADGPDAKTVLKALKSLLARTDDP